MKFSLSAQAAEAAVDAAVEVLRLLWRAPLADGRQDEMFHSSRMQVSEGLISRYPSIPGPLAERIAGLLQCVEDKYPISFADFVVKIFEDEVCFEDIKYFAMRSLRDRYGVVLSARVAAAAHVITRRLSVLLEHNAETNLRIIWESALAALVDAELDASTESLRGAFVDLCFLLGLFELKNTEGDLTVHGEAFNAEFLVSSLFGVPASIPGFDQLFGGGGITLAEADTSDQSLTDNQRTDAIGGRSILCFGPFGSGKTLLTLAFAVEVARKGGVAWIMSFEQTEEECLYALELLGIATHHPAFVLVTGGLRDSFLAFSKPRPDRGALVFLRPIEGNHDYSTFLENVKEKLSWMSTYPLRLLIVDPINTFSHSTTDQTNGREMTRSLFEAAKKANVNTWFVSEKTANAHLPERFEENIADTVIHLDTETVAGQKRRYIEVTKSRFQRESSGRHTLSIGSKSGIKIFPSSSLIHEFISTRRRAEYDVPLQLGVPGGERLLGPELIRPGDLIVLSGEGKAKTLIGVKFLLSNDRNEEIRSVYISDQPDHRILRSLTTLAEPDQQSQIPSIERCSLTTGHIAPGLILQEIESALRRAEECKPRALRVLLTNVSRWEEEIPMLAEDSAFAIALVRLLRSHNAAAMVVSGDSSYPHSRLRNTLLSQADISLQFNRRDLQGRVTIILNTLKTRSMQHQKENFELVLEHGVSVQPAPLFRILPSGAAEPIKIRLFLYAETENHKAFNDEMLEGLKASISPAAVIDSRNRRFDSNLLSISRYSALDELQVFQLDEFQLPTIPAAVVPIESLYSFDAKRHGALLAGRIPQLCENTYLEDRKRFLAVPFYANFSFFAIWSERFAEVRKELEVDNFPESWSGLAKLCAAWDSKNPQPTEFLFECPIYDGGVETYNCLFFEILWSMKDFDPNQSDDLAEWFKWPVAVEAAYILRQVCKAAHVKSNRAAVPHKAIISRSWYNTLNQELSMMDEHEGGKLEIRPLFGDLTTAGEWYLAVPAMSSSPEVGLQIIEYLTTPEFETARAELGIGLPVRSAYYQGSPKDEVSISRYFQFSRTEVLRLLRDPIRRSRFRYYQRYSNTISSHLQWIIELDDQKTGDKESDEVLLKQRIAASMRSLASNVRFLTEAATG